MRAFFLLLVLANLVLFAYAHVVRESGGVESRIPLLQLSPDKIKLLKATAGSAPEKPAAAAPGPASGKGEAQVGSPVPGACLEWGIFAGPDVARAAGALARLELPQGQAGRTVADSGAHWVHIPPLKTRADVDRKIGELRALGVSDFFVVQEGTQWRNAISLGIFRSEGSAKAFLGKLRERGVRSAVAEWRENFLKQVAFFVREPSEATVARLAQLQQEFPGSELKAVPCPPAEAAKG